MRKIVVKVPEEMISAASSKEVREKPFNLCLSCPFYDETCPGPPIQSTTLPRVLELADGFAHKQNRTRQQIAEKMNMSLATINSVMSGRTEDPRFSTISAIMNAPASGKCFGKAPCHLAQLMLNDEMVDYDEVSIASANIRIENLEKTLADERDQHRRTIDFLKEQIAFKEKTILDSRSMIENRNKTVKTLGIIVGILASVLLILFMVDAFVPTVGWFRY